MNEGTEKQSALFAADQADSYFERNGWVRGFVADYLLSLFPKKTLSGYDVAEFGIGGGQNLILFKNYVQSCHGYDASQKAIDCFSRFFSQRPDSDSFYAARVNLCEPFSAPIPYNLIIYGFFAYYVSDEELNLTKTNTLQALKPGGYVFVHDFLSRANLNKPDRHDSRLKVYKRNLAFWLNHFSEFDLIHFRVIDDGKARSDRERDEFHTIDPDLPKDDTRWNFCALFRLREKTVG